jgi:hypothetical protein
MQTITTIENQELAEIFAWKTSGRRKRLVAAFWKRHPGLRLRVANSANVDPSMVSNVLLGHRMPPDGLWRILLRELAKDGGETRG